MATSPVKVESTSRPGEGQKHEIKIGEPECPRCKKSFTHELLARRPARAGPLP